MVNNIIMTSDNDVAKELKKAGFQLSNERDGIYQFILNKSIKFNFSSFGDKIIFSNKMNF